MHKYKGKVNCMDIKNFGSRHTKRNYYNKYKCMLTVVLLIFNCNVGPHSFHQYHVVHILHDGLHYVSLLSVCWCYKGNDVLNVLHVDSAAVEYFLLQEGTEWHWKHVCTARPFCTWRIPANVHGDVVRVSWGRNAQHYTYGICAWVLLALPRITCGGVAYCRGSSRKQPVYLAQCVALTRITPYLRYGVVMLTYGHRPLTRIHLIAPTNPTV